MKAPNVAPVTWKMAEDGRGTILRLKEIAGKEADTRIEIPRSEIHSAMLCSGVEDDREKLNVDNNSITLKFPSIRGFDGSLAALTDEIRRP